MIDRLWPYACNGVRLVLADRGVLFVDFFVATGVAFAIQYLVWTNVYTEGREIHGFSISELLYYCALVIFLLRLNNCYDVVEDISNDVVEGRIEVHSSRPVGYLWQKFAAYTCAGLPYLIPVIIINLVLWFTNSPHGVTDKFTVMFHLALATCLVIQGICLSFLVGILLGLGTFWLVRDDFLLAFLTTVSAFLGGAIIPPSFWPEVVRPIMEWNPLQFYIAAPAILMVTGDWQAGLRTVFGASIYIGVFVLFVRWLWPRALATYTGAGG